MATGPLVPLCFPVPLVPVPLLADRRDRPNRRGLVKSRNYGRRESVSAFQAHCDLNAKHNKRLKTRQILRDPILCAPFRFRYEPFRILKKEN